MNIEEFKTATREQKKAYGDTFKLGYTYDQYGNITRTKTLDNYWAEKIYDKNKKCLSYVNFDYNHKRFINGYWSQYTYDKNGKELTSENNLADYYKHFDDEEPAGLEW